MKNWYYYQKLFTWLKVTLLQTFISLLYAFDFRNIAKKYFSEISIHDGFYWTYYIYTFTLHSVNQIIITTFSKCYEEYL